MRKDIKKVDTVMQDIAVKEAVEIKDSAETDVDSEFTIRSVMVLREAIIDLYQQTGFSPPADLQTKLQKIKTIHDRLDRIKIRRAELEADAQAGRTVDLDSGWD